MSNMVALFVVNAAVALVKMGQIWPDVDLSDCVRFSMSSCDCRIFSPQPTFFRAISALLPDSFQRQHELSSPWHLEVVHMFYSYI